MALYILISRPLTGFRPVLVLSYQENSVSAGSLRTDNILPTLSLATDRHHICLSS
jgi:hypothetical protein